MANFSEPALQVVSQTVVEGDPSTLYIAMNVSMDNPSPVSISNMGVLNFSMIVRAPRTVVA
jgi:hypothetical protein